MSPCNKERTRGGRRHACRVVVAALLALAAASPGARAATPVDGAPKGFERIGAKDVAHVALRDQAGGAVEPATLHGRLVLLNLWATWCPPCMAEMPALDRLAADLPAGSFAVVAVAEDDGGLEQAGPTLDKLQAEHVIRWADPHQRLTRKLAIRELPATLILLPDGRLAGVFRGTVDWDDPAVRRFLMDLPSGAR
ncbi:MAG: redoxin family protein [Alphaproteobacteria bacterium]|nr:redoxin family protein [Alphaproteobacteria bacterium]